MSNLTVLKIDTKDQLFAALGASGNLNVLVNGRVGTLLSVQREDGSGTKFNVVLCRYDNVTMRFVNETLFMNFGQKTY